MCLVDYLFEGYLTLFVRIGLETGLISHTKSLAHEFLDAARWLAELANATEWLDNDEAYRWN